MSHTARIHVKLIAAMALWGGTWIAGRIIAQEVSAPLAAASLRFVLAGLVLAGAALAGTGSIPRPRSFREWGWVFGLGFFGIFLYGVCFFYGLRHLAAGRAALVVALNPVMVFLVAWLLGQESMDRRKTLGCLIALGGSLTVIGNGDPLVLLRGGLGPGESWLVGCVLSWTIYTFVARFATQILSPLAATLHASLVGALLLGLAALMAGEIHLAAWSWRVWASIVFLAVFGTAIGYTWFTEAVQQLGAGHASAFINLVPVFAVLQAAALLNERLGLAVLGGGALVLTGVWLITGMRNPGGIRKSSRRKILP